MKKLFLGIIVILLATSTNVLSADRAYVGLATGLSFHNDSEISYGASKVVFSPGVVASGVVGYAFGNGVRLEGEVSYRRADFKTIGGDVSSLTGLGNFYYDIKNDSTVTPYLGFGLGYSRVDWKPDSGISGDDKVLAYQVATGLGIEMSKHVVLDIGYRYFATQDIMSNSVNAEYRNHNVTIGVKYMF